MGFKDILEVCILGFFAAFAVFAVFAVMLTFAYLFPSDSANVHKLDYLGADGHHINLTENPNATYVTYEQVINFVDNDTTDQMLYNSSFQCADYAEMLHNHAEAAGYNLRIRCSHSWSRFWSRLQCLRHNRPW